MIQQFAMTLKLINQILMEELFDSIVIILIGAECETLMQLNQVYVSIAEKAREDF